MKKSMINVNKMIETYVSYGIDEETWKMFYNMACHGLITNETWVAFSDKCKGWYIEGNKIFDGYRDNNVIYETDEYGFFKKVG